MKKIIEYFETLWKEHKVAIFYSLILLLVLFLFVTILKYDFFKDYKPIDYSAIAAPAVSLFSAAILFLALYESIRFNKNQLAFNQNQLEINKNQLEMNEYQILLQDFELIKKNLKEQNLFFLRHSAMSPDKADGLDFYYMFFLYYESLKAKNPFIIDNFNLYNERFFNSVVKPLLFKYNNLEIFVNDVIENEILSKRYKNKLYLKVEKQLLEHYFIICNDGFVDDNGGSHVFDLTIFETFTYKFGTEEQKKFESKDFYKLNKLFNDKKLFYKDSAGSK
jgi:hypothetical protein